MKPHSSPRRLLLVAAFVASLASLALASRAEARHPPGARPLPAVRAVLADGPWTAAVDFVRGLLHCVWANVGSSLDPLGNH